MTGRPQAPVTDDDWLAALAGRPGDRETALLRDILRAAEQDAGAAVDIEHNWQRLRFALRRERAAGRWRRPGAALLARAAMVLVAVAAVVQVALLAPDTAVAPAGSAADDGEAMVMRGRAGADIAAADPAAAAASLAGRLRAIGIAIEPVAGADPVELRLALRPPLDPRLRQLLAEEGVEPPAAGELRLRFVPTAH